MPFPTTFVEHFLQQTPFVFFVYDVASQRVTYINSAYERLLNGHSDQVNEELADLIARVHPDDYEHAADCWQRWQAGRLHEAFELHLLTLDGSDQWLSITPYLFTDAEPGLQLGGLVQDITVTKVAMWHADKYNSKKNTTLEILSHDLAGPLAMLQQMSDYIQEAAAPLQNAELTSMIEHMRVLCRDSVNLIHDFVDHEFLDSVNVELKRERVDLVEKLRLIMEEYQASAPALHKHFVFEAKVAPLYLEIDQNKLMQAIGNLLSNSLKFTPDGGTITLRVEQQQGLAIVTVADTGIGIPQSVQAGLFEKFTHARRPGLRGERSTGLGMSIIKSIVELHQGRIYFHSQEGEGTVFTVELPLLDEQVNTPLG
ncbi:ATP-binding protein [Hymenobacter sp. GOD-10R]|uniref:sensor histidine kinase n=1 Tax=Hymenobacter sp. GOD-10R TaxID=3093922 RepID=UPI002D79B2EE|nr:ATP-binding protein [Hymenobacter sp. GOD-10R]WRQ27667.1 ATP-binding protein [Hymenobacter sp. GOD-10R]